MAYSIKEVLELCGVSRTSLYREIGEGALEIRIHGMGSGRSKLERTTILMKPAYRSPGCDESRIPVVCYKVSIQVLGKRSFFRPRFYSYG
jgi:hypothetical protein